MQFGKMQKWIAFTDGNIANRKDDSYFAPGLLLSVFLLIYFSSSYYLKDIT